MNSRPSEILEYRRARFGAALPLRYRYTPQHFWIADQEAGTWRVGLTKFGSRLLGEVVDYGFELAAGQAVAGGQIVGWVEGFKTITELAAPGQGEFVGANPALERYVTLVNQDPQGAGWLYAMRGVPASDILDAAAYATVLNREIDKWLAQHP